MGKMGRPTNAENPPQLNYEAEHEGHVLLGDERVWIEGEVIIYEEDMDAQAIRVPLQNLIDRMNRQRIDETGQPMTDGLVYCSQRVPRALPGQRPRRYTSRAGVDNRLTLGSLEHVLSGLPGRTLQELTVDLYPGSDPHVAKAREPTLRMALRRLQLAGRLRFERDPQTGKKRYFTTKVQAYMAPADQRAQLLAMIIASHLGGQPDDHASLVQAVVETIDHNLGRVDDLWRDPRGQLRTDYERANPLPAKWDEHLPPEPDWSLTRALDRGLITQEQYDRMETARREEHQRKLAVAAQKKDALDVQTRLTADPASLGDPF